MAEKKNFENEIENELKNEANILPTEDYNDLDDEFVDAFGSESSNSRTMDSEKVFTTKYPVQKGKPTYSNGKEYQNYAVAFRITINGEKRPMVILVRAKGGGEKASSLLDSVMSSKGDHKLEIVKRTMRDTQTNRVNHIYSMQVSGVTDEGFPLSCPLDPAYQADKSIFANFRIMLQNRGDIE